MGIVSDRERNFPHYLFARFLFISVILGLTIAFMVESPGSRLLLLFLFLSNLTLIAVTGFYFKVRGADAFLRWMTLSVGVVLDTAVIYYTEGAVSEFVFLYFFSIGAASLFLGLKGSLAIAVLAEIGYAFLLMTWHPALLETLAFQLFLYGVYFILTALLTGYLAEKLQSKHRDLVSTQRELSQTRFETEAILKSLGTGLLVVADSGDVLYFNPAGRKILGLTDIENAEAESVFVQEFITAIQKEETDAQRMEIEVRLPNNSSRPVGCSVSALTNGEGSRRGKIILFADLTAAKEEERERRRRERLAAVGELARDLAHEIRNPLATIIGSAEILGNEAIQSSDNRRLGNIVIRESKRLNDLIRDFSAFARLEIPRKKPINLADVLKNRHEDWIDVQMPDFFPVSADEGQLEMIVSAVLMGLSLWAEEGDRIKITAQNPATPEAHVQFRLPKKVLPEDALDSVFQPFNETWKRRLGLALPTALRAVEGHGGRLQLCSHADEGTWFDLVLESADGFENEKERAKGGI